MDDKIDVRYEDETLLVCTKCGTICCTKNINRIGARSIKPAYDGTGDGLDSFSINYLALDKCNESGHLTGDLRLLTEEEVEMYKDTSKITEHNEKYIKDDYK